MVHHISDEKLIKIVCALNLDGCRDLAFERVKDGIEILVPTMKLRALAEHIWIEILKDAENLDKIFPLYCVVLNEDGTYSIEKVKKHE